MYLGLLREVLLCQHHAKIQHYLSRTCSSLFQEQATTERKGKGRAICILMNLIATPNCTLSITSRQMTGHQVLANTACQMLIPNTAFVVGMRVEGSVGGGPYRTGTKKLFLSSLADLSSSAAAITELHGCSFFFYYYSSYHHAQRSSTGQRKSAKDTSPAVSNSRAHLPWQITHCPLLLPPRARGAQSQHRGTKPQGPRCAQVTQGQQGDTHGGKGANLFDVLFITLGAGGPPGGPSGVPEGVVILQGVLSWPRDHSLQNRKACLPLVCSSKKGNGKKYIYSI